MQIFLRWLLFCAVLIVGILWAGYNGVFHELYSADSTYIGIAVIIWFAISTLLCGYRTYILSVVLSKYGMDTCKLNWVNSIKNSTSQSIDRFRFASSSFTVLGMIGTVWGFCHAIQALFIIKPGDLASQTLGLKLLGEGVSVALYTTFVGLVCQLLLKIQSFNLSQAINRHTDEVEELA